MGGFGRVCEVLPFEKRWEAVGGLEVLRGPDATGLEVLGGSGKALGSQASHLALDQTSSIWPEKTSPDLQTMP